MDEDGIDDFLYGKEEAHALREVKKAQASEEARPKERECIAESSELEELESEGSADSVDLVLEPKRGASDGSAAVALVIESKEEDGPKEERKGIDIEKIGIYNGKPITNVKIESFEERPWAKPGADITDYFNYGFDEEKWQIYCQYQKKMRSGVFSLKGDIGKSGSGSSNDRRYSTRDSDDGRQQHGKRGGYVRTIHRDHGEKDDYSHGVSKRTRSKSPDQRNGSRPRANDQRRSDRPERVIKMRDGPDRDQERERGPARRNDVDRGGENRRDQGYKRQGTQGRR